MISVVFAYEVEAGARAEFERVYGSGGEWARFFSRAGEAYLGTELQRSVERVARYLLIDRWTTEAAYEAFLAANAAEYERRSHGTAALYRSETRIGAFERVDTAGTS